METVEHVMVMPYGYHLAARFLQVEKVAGGFPQVIAVAESQRPQ
jgi:hypothetical protein